MNINIYRLRGVEREIAELRKSIDRLIELYEMHLQHTERLTTRVEPAPPSALKETIVSYTDPEYAEIVERMERKAGRKLDDDELAQIGRLLEDDAVDE